MNIEGVPEDERLAILANLNEVRPGLSSKVAGTLSGPATPDRPDRPDVPVWEYEEFLRIHPDVSMHALVATRFPVVFFGGKEFTIESVSAHLDDDAPWLPRMTVESVIDLWRALSTAGVVRWDSGKRGVEFIRPDEERNRVYREWWERRRSATEQDLPLSPRGEVARATPHSSCRGCRVAAKVRQ